MMETNRDRDDGHKLWGTLAGEQIETLQRQQRAFENSPVQAVEYRADLIPPSVLMTLLKTRSRSTPAFVAHFGIGPDAATSSQALKASCEQGVDGILFHSRSERSSELVSLCRTIQKPFVAAFHSQRPMSYEQLIVELRHQEALEPAFCKLAVRAETFDEAMAVIRATREFHVCSKLPIASAVLGSQRWARTVLPHAGSSITFLTTEPLLNENGGDDSQFQLDEWKQIESLLAGQSARHWPHI